MPCEVRCSEVSACCPAGPLIFSRDEKGCFTWEHTCFLRPPSSFFVCLFVCFRLLFLQKIPDLLCIAEFNLCLTHVMYFLRTPIPHCICFSKSNGSPSSVLQSGRRDREGAPSRLKLSLLLVSPGTPLPGAPHRDG